MSDAYNLCKKWLELENYSFHIKINVIYSTYKTFQQDQYFI